MPADAPKGYEGAPSDAPSGKRADTLAEDASGTISQPHERLKYYVAIARPDHWVKNVFMLLGTAAAFVIHPSYFSWSAVPPLLLGLFSVCLIASSNYVLNEILDARFDRAHPEKRLRPLAR